MDVELGTIEGFFGRPYGWEARAALMQALAPGYSFHIYAPKADAHLRRRWREPHPRADAQRLDAFGRACREAGVKFGIGLSPFELHFNFDAEAKRALKDKLAQIDAVGCDWLAILFDDMRGDLVTLAEAQAEIVAFASELTRATRVLVCPTYYSDDPVLDRVFGPRPAGYLEALGRRLDPAIDVMWTGEEVCSREHSLGHLARVADALGRRPFLWDNYPVNDGPRMSRRLHLRAFTGRPAAIGAALSGHAVNPAVQPTLSRIPMLTLAASYRLGASYAYAAAFAEAARAVCGEALARRLTDDLYTLEDAGLDGLTDARKARLRERYAAFDHPAATEVVGFLDGVFTATDEEVLTQ